LDGANCLAKLNEMLRPGGEFWRAMDQIGVKRYRGEQLTAAEHSLFAFFVRDGLDRGEVVRKNASRAGAIADGQDNYRAAFERGDQKGIENARKQLRNLVPNTLRPDVRDPIVAESISLDKQLADARSRVALLRPLSEMPVRDRIVWEWDGKRRLTPADCAGQQVSDFCRNLDAEHPCHPIHLQDGMTCHYYVSPRAWADLTAEMRAEIRTLERETIPELEAKAAAAKAEMDRLIDASLDIYVPLAEGE
jgi:hypothetical protein